MNRATSNPGHFLNWWAFLINVFFLLAPPSLGVLFAETIVEMNGRYSSYKREALPHSLVYIIKRDHPLKVDGIINIVQMMVIVDHSSSDSAIRRLAPGPLPTIIAARTASFWWRWPPNIHIKRGMQSHETRLRSREYINACTRKWLAQKLGWHS